MRIAVCVKSVLDVSFPFSLDMETLRPLEEDVFYKVNPADACAAEVALMLRETRGGEVFFVTYGPERAEKALRDCLAMGGNRAIRVWEDRLDVGSRARAYMLAKALEGLSPDLVLCGSRSVDEGTGETPPAMAEFLGWPQVTGVTRLNLSEDGTVVVAERKRERGRREEIECPLPAVLALEPGVRKPRYAALPNLLEAKGAEIVCLKSSDLKVDGSLLEEFGSLIELEGRSLPRPRPKKIATMEKGLSAEERLEWMMSGGLKQSKGDLLEGPPQEVARRLADILKEKVLDTFS